MSSRGRILSLSCFSIMQKYIILSWEHCLISQTLRAPRVFAARSRSAGGGEPLRARLIDIISAFLVTLNLTLESVLASENQVQVLALEVPNTLKVVAPDERLVGDACTTLFAGC
jgi:hypothetical protein